MRPEARLIGVTADTTLDRTSPMNKITPHPSYQSQRGSRRGASPLAVLRFSTGSEASGLCSTSHTGNPIPSLGPRWGHGGIDMRQAASYSQLESLGGHRNALAAAAGWHGRVAEWSNAPVLKTGVPQGTGGSNPSPTAWLFCVAAQPSVDRCFL